MHFNAEAYEQLNKYLVNNTVSSIFVLVDSNTAEFCLPRFLSALQTETTIETIEIEPGEASKTIETCMGVWETLSDLGADRKSLIINVGGGVVTDLGGFVASTFKRGIPYINVPTSLLAMVDASVGGKTGVDLGALKNQIGVIAQSQMVLIDTHYLNTLPGKEMRSGHAEILKHGLIASKDYWLKAINLSELTMDSYDELIYESVIIKNNIVTQDPTEQGMRKALNFGHTLGHAIESFLLEHEEKAAILHGEAVAVGMILALYLSVEHEGFPKAESLKACESLKGIYGGIDFNKKDIEAIIGLLKFDKKNVGGRINFVLLKDFGKPVFDCQVSNTSIYEAFEFYDAL